MAMSMRDRFGTGLLLAGGLGLILLMGYTLSLGVGSPGETARQPASGVAEVAVFFPDRADWDDFVLALRCAGRRGLARDLRPEGDAVLARTAGGREVRFTWHGVWGVRPTEEEARRLSPVPEAVVGSVNTVLTVALAEALHEAAEAGTYDARPAPVLLVPWASSVLVDLPPRGPEPIRLLDIYPGRTFRFCADNRGEADLVVDWLLHHEPGSAPDRAIIVVERGDPYSRDLADGFRRAISAAVPRAELVEQADALGPVAAIAPNRPGLPEVIGPQERRWADATWRTALDAPEGRPTWVVLPLQSEPAMRLLGALRARAPHLPAGDGPLRVLCGDGIGSDRLAELAGQVPFPIACVSSSSIPRQGRESAGETDETDVQTLAEIASAVLRALDRTDAGQGLHKALLALDIAADDPSAFGRSLAFAPSGQRHAGDGLGHVLATRPGSAEILAFARGPDSGWTEPVPIRPAPAEGHP